VNITYTGKQEFLHPKQKEQIDTKLSRVAKLLDVDGKGEKQARVALTHDKNLHRAEVTLNYLDHTLVGEHVDPDQFTALSLAVERLERQIMRVRDKRRDIKKGPREGWDKGASANAIIEAGPRNPDALSAAPSSNGKPKIYRVGPEDNKPLTADEAMLLIGDDQYVVYHDSGTGRLAALIRRGDGNFDLIQC